MSDRVKLGDAESVDLAGYKALYLVSVEIDGFPTGVLVGKKGTDLGIDVLSGAEILTLLDKDTDLGEQVREAIKRCDEKGQHSPHS